MTPASTRDPSGGAMKRILALSVLLAGWLPLNAAAVCFTVLEGTRIVYRDLVSPIDLSGPISEAMRYKYPGGQLLISTEDDLCTLITPTTAVDVRGVAQAMAAAAPAPPAAPAPAANAGTPAAAPAARPAAPANKPN
jgi:hypothetical protein